MSTDYLPSTPIPFDQIKGLKIEELYEEQTKDISADSACLTDGKNYLWASKTSFNFTWFSRYGGNRVDDILEILAKHFDTEFISEHSDEWEEVLYQCIEGLDYVNIPLPTPDNPGLWKQIYP